MDQILTDYKGQHSSRKPRIRMLTGCTWWDKGCEYNVQYETENDNGGELYINDENGGIAMIEKKDEGKEFVYVRKGKRQPPAILAQDGAGG
jgi:hypothetical protein